MTTSLGAEGGLSTGKTAELKQAQLEQSAASSPALLETLELLHLVAYFADPLTLGRCPDRTPDDFFRVAPDSACSSTDSAHKNA